MFGKTAGNLLNRCPCGAVKVKTNISTINFDQIGTSENTKTQYCSVTLSNNGDGQTKDDYYSLIELSKQCNLGPKITSLTIYKDKFGITEYKNNISHADE